MKVVIQRVKQCSVSINGNLKSEIKKGLLILVGFENDDTLEDIKWVSNKVVSLRIFNDSQGIMNLSLKDIEGEIIIVSQFTLHAKTKKGNRPSYIKAAKPEISIPLYEQFIKEIQKSVITDVKTGEFGADMQVSLVNDGPATIIIDSKNK